MASPTQQPVEPGADAAPPPAAQVLQMVLSCLIAQMVHAFVKHGLPDHLAGRPRTAGDLAKVTGLHEESLRRLLRALTGLGMVTQKVPGQFELTPLSSVLTTDDSSGVREMVLLIENLWWPAWAQFPDAIATGRTGTELAHDATLFEFLEQHPSEQAMFIKAMNGINFGQSDAVAEAYDFRDARRVIDIGGGNGTGIAAVLQRYRDVHGVLFDLPSVTEEGGTALGEHAARCELIGGDFFDSVPGGGDVYLLSHVIHDWDRDQCITILRNCREAMAPGGRILIIETVIAPGDGPDLAKVSDMAMLAFTGGMERTEEEYRDLLAAAGLTLTHVIPTQSPVSIVEAKTEPERFHHA
jgi:hypothetical protein